MSLEARVVCGIVGALVFAIGFLPPTDKASYACWFSGGLNIVIAFLRP